MSCLFAHPFFVFIFFFSLLLSPLYPSCSVHSLLMRLMWTVSLWALGMAAVLLQALKELWERFIHTALVQLAESWLYKRNHSSFYVKLWFKQWKHGHLWSWNGILSHQRDLWYYMLLMPFSPIHRDQNNLCFQIWLHFFPQSLLNAACVHCSF